MRWHVIQAVFKRNFLSYFSGVIGYLFIVAFVGAGSFIAFSPQFFASNLANLDQLNQWYPWLLLFIVPAITMNVWSDERRQGTDELLFTLPASDGEVLAGKFLAVLGVYTVALAFSLSHVVVLLTLGQPDLGLILTTYIGYWLSGAALLSVGMVASALTSSATVAYVLGVLICLVPVAVGQLSPGDPFVSSLSVAEQFRDFGMGMLPLGGVLYFISLTVVMLYLNLVLISKRHWAGGPHQTPMGLHFLTRTVSLAIALIGANALAANVTWRADFTSERLYTLSTTTRAAIAEIKPERRVLIQAFVSPEVPQQYVPVRTSVLGLLRQFDQAGGNRVQVRIVSTTLFSESAEEAERLGITPKQVLSERAGRQSVENVFLGVVITASSDDQVVIPFFELGMSPEYEMTRGIQVVTRTKRAVLGILRTDAKMTGGFDMQSFRSIPEWRIVTELKKAYDVKEVGPDELATTTVDVLLAAMPSSLNDRDMKSFVDYVQQGRPTLIFDDPFCPLIDPGLSPKLPKPRQGGGGMFGGGPPPEPKAFGGEATSLMKALGMAWDSGETVWDLYVPHPELEDILERFDAVFIARKSGGKKPFSDQSPISSGLQEVMLLWPGNVLKREDSPHEFIPLMRTSPRSTSLKWDEYTISSGPFGGVMPQPAPTLRFPASGVGTEYVVAARIKGRQPGSTGAAGAKDEAAKTAEKESSPKPGDLPPVNVVYVADLDMLSDQFFFLRENPQWQEFKFDNITFVLNAVDDLAGDVDVIELRTRRQQHRTLSAVEAATRQYKEAQAQESMKASLKGKEELDSAKKSLQDEIKRIESDTTLDERTKAIQLRAAQENERRRLEVREKEIKNEMNREVTASKARMERSIRRIEELRRWMAIILPPIPALVLGLFVFAARVRDEQLGVAPERLVRRKS